MSTEDSQEVSSTSIATLDPMREALVWILYRVRTISQVQDLDEESFTSMILGGLAFVTPLLSAFLDSTPNDQGDFRWGLFKKSGGAASPFSETATGADFCVVIGHDADTANLALFQAKKTDYKKPRTLPIRRGPAESAEGNTQFTMLAAFACRLMAHAGHPNFEDFRQDGSTLTSAAKLVGNDHSVSRGLIEDIGWVHYLIYRDSTATTIPICEIDDRAVRAELAFETPISHKLSGYGLQLASTITGGVEGLSSAWLNIRRDVLQEFLPELIEIGAVVVADGRGGRRLTPNSDRLDLSVAGLDSLEPWCSTAIANAELWKDIRPRPAPPTRKPRP